MNLDYCTSPESYARKLASYIKNPSTLRVRTLEYWGRAPSVDKCSRFISEANRPAAPHEDETFIPSMLAKWSCGHEVNADNAYLKDTGDYGCIICRRKMQADAAKRYREKKAREKLLAEEQANRRAVLAFPKKRAHKSTARFVYVNGVMTACLEAVCAASHMLPNEVTGKGRAAEGVICRAVVYTLARRADLSYPEIAKWMKRDHSSVLHALRDSSTVRKFREDFETILTLASEALAEAQRQAA